MVSVRSITIVKEERLVRTSVNESDMRTEFDLFVNVELSAKIHGRVLREEVKIAIQGNVFEGVEELFNKVEKYVREE